MDKFRVKDLLSNSRGVAMFAVLTWSAIGTVMLLGVAKTLTNTINKSSYAKVKINQAILADVVTERLSSESSCSEAIDKTKPFSQNNSSQIVFDLGNRIGRLGTGLELPSLNLRVVDTHLAVPSAPNDNLGADPRNSSNRIWLRDVRARVAPMNTKSGPSVFKEVTLTSIGVVVQGDRIMGCQPIDQYPVAKCSVADKIYLPSGFENPHHDVDGSPDENGCVSHSAFRGQKGVRGDNGPKGPRGAAGPRGPRGDHDVRGGCSMRRGWCTGVRCPSGGRVIRCRCSKPTTCRGGRWANWSGRRCGPIRGCRMRGNRCEVNLGLPSGLNVHATVIARCRFD